MLTWRELNHIMRRRIKASQLLLAALSLKVTYDTGGSRYINVVSENGPNISSYRPKNK